MRLPFALSGSMGQVEVVVAVNDDPHGLGCRESARGFPYCHASIRHPARGYAAALGWIQLVRSTDNASGGVAFELDPFEPLGEVSHPFCFFGFLPALFDAPSRDPVSDMEWIAHSFLCRLGERDRQVEAMLGFTWGFVIRDGAITVRSAEVLDDHAWDAHAPLLTRDHPGWSFVDGFADSRVRRRS